MIYSGEAWYSFNFNFLNLFTHYFIFFKEEKGGYGYYWM